MRRVLQVFLSTVVVVSGVILYNLLRDAQWAHSWAKTILVTLPEIGTIIAVFELHHSAKANELRIERNELAEANNSLAAANNELAEENNELQRKFQAERNEHLAEIARQMHRPQTAAERNASKLREHLGSPVLVLNNDNSRAGTPQIAEASGGNIVALFQPTQHGSQASVIYADCEDVELIEIAQGACPLQVKVRKRYGSPVQLGEITKWEDRRTPVAVPTFERGGTAHHAHFRKPGSPETRSLLIYSSKDGANSFQLEASTGEQFVGDNKAVSIRFLSQQVEYLADGFVHNGGGSGATKHPLFLN